MVIRIKIVSVGNGFNDIKFNDFVLFRRVIFRKIMEIFKICNVGLLI